MSTPDGEPMFPADYGSAENTRERLIAWEVPLIVADSEAMKMALQEYIVRLMFEGNGWGLKIAEFYADAIKAAVKEYQSSPIIKRAEMKDDEFDRDEEDRDF